MTKIENDNNLNWENFDCPVKMCVAVVYWEDFDCADC